MLSPNCFWMMGDERQADLGALLVFRYWLRQQLGELAAEEELAAESIATMPEREPGSTDSSYGRLFF